LDALPAHLLTPFNGPVPPSNLLDKIARGVAQAKGPEEWPHSIRATRMKLMELARTRDKEATQEAQRRKMIREEDEEDEDEEYFGFGEVLRSTINTTPRRSLHRQSNVDAMNVDKPDINDNTSRSVFVIFYQDLHSLSVQTFKSAPTNRTSPSFRYYQ
jgi:transcription factor SPN1